MENLKWNTAKTRYVILNEQNKQKIIVYKHGLRKESLNMITLEEPPN